MPRKRHGRALFNHQRVEPWQRDIRAGDCFVLMVQPGFTIYGRVVRKSDGEELECKTYSSLFPRGEREPMVPSMMDLPLTEKQFSLARKCGWPGDMSSVRVIVGMIMPEVNV